MAVQSGVSLANLFYWSREAGTAACQCQEREVFRRTAPPVSSLGTRPAVRRPLPASVVSCAWNGQEGNSGLLEGHVTGGRRSACDGRQLIPRVQGQRSAVQPHRLC